MTIVKVRLTFDLELEAFSPQQAISEAEKVFIPVRTCSLKTLNTPGTIEIIELDEGEMKAAEAHQQTLSFSVCGDVLFVENFWDCECGNTYRKLENPNCRGCGCSHGECPDSRAVELLAFSRHILTSDERLQIAQELDRLSLKFPAPI